MKLGHSLKSYIKYIQNVLKIYMYDDTVKLLEKNIGRSFFDINHSKIFSDPPPRVMKIKTKVNK